MPETTKQSLSASTLHTLDDGMVGRVVDAAIQEALRDCEDRPGLNKARKVTIQLEVTPLQDKRSHALRGVNTTVQVKATVPATGTRTEFLYTSHDTSAGKVDAALPSAHQDSMFDERQGN